MGTKSFFTEDELALLATAVDRTYEAVAGDLSLIDVCDGDEDSSISREDLFQIVVDADRLKTFGVSPTDTETKEVVRKFYTLSWPEMREYAKRLLPFDRYEV